MFHLLTTSRTLPKHPNNVHNIIKFYQYFMTSVNLARLLRDYLSDNKIQIPSLLIIGPYSVASALIDRVMDLAVPISSTFILPDESDPVGVLQGVRDAQKQSATRALVVFKDFSAAMNETVGQTLLTSRHYRILTILTMQTARHVPPAIRTNLDYVLILKGDHNLTQLYEWFGGAYESIKTFRNSYETCMERSGCMVLDNIQYTPYVLYLDPEDLWVMEKPVQEP